MNPKLNKFRNELERNTRRIADMQARNEELQRLVVDMEHQELQALLAKSGLTFEDMSARVLRMQEQEAEAARLAAAEQSADELPEDAEDDPARDDDYDQDEVTEDEAYEPEEADYEEADGEAVDGDDFDSDVGDDAGGDWDIR